MENIMTQQRAELNKAINLLWQLHDEAQAAGKTAEASQYSAQAFALLERLPENTIYLQTEQ